MKYLSNLDLNSKVRVVNLPDPISDGDAVSKSYVANAISKAISGLDYQKDILGVQTDSTLDPGTIPKLGDRYLLKDVTKLNSNFGIISGADNGDIVEHTASGFVVAYDVSDKGDGILVFNKGDEEWYHYVSSTWTSGGLSAILDGRGLDNNEGVFNVLTDDLTIGIDSNNNLYVKDKSIGKSKLAADAVSDGLKQNADGSLAIKVDSASSGVSVSVGENGLKIVTESNKAAIDLGDGTSTEITAEHTLNTEDIIAMVRAKSSPQTKVGVDITVVDATHVKFTFANAPSVNEYRAVIMG